LANYNYGAINNSFVASLTLDQRALLGSKLLQVALDTFNKTLLESHRRIIWQPKAGKF
jgi:hypothetical protein